MRRMLSNTNRVSSPVLACSCIPSPSHNPSPYIFFQVSKGFFPIWKYSMFNHRQRYDRNFFGGREGGFSNFCLITTKKKRFYVGFFVDFLAFNLSVHIMRRKFTTEKSGSIAKAKILQNISNERSKNENFKGICKLKVVIFLISPV